METDKIVKRKILWGLLIASAFIESLTITIIKRQFNILGKVDLSALSDIFEYSKKLLEPPIVLVAASILIFSPLLPFIVISRMQISLAYPVLVALHLFFITIFSHLLLPQRNCVKLLWLR